MNQASKLSLTFLGTVFLFLVSSLLVAIVLRVAAVPYYVTTLLSEAVLAVPCLIYLKKNGKTLGRVVHLRVPGLGNLFVAWLLSYTVQPVVSLLSYGSNLLFGDALTGMVEEMGSFPYLTNVVFVALIPAVLEELIFRGVYYREFRKYGFWKAALGSSLFFGLLHMNLNQLTYGFAFGFILCLVQEAAGSIYAPMLIHFGLNYSAVRSIRSITGAVVDADTAAGNGGLGQLLQMPLDEGVTNALVLVILAAAALISFGVSALLLWLMAKTNDRDKYLAWMLGRGERQYQKKAGYPDSARIFFSPLFFISCLTALGMLLLFGLS